MNITDRITNILADEMAKAIDAEIIQILTNQAKQSRQDKLRKILNRISEKELF